MTTLRLNMMNRLIARPLTSIKERHSVTESITPLVAFQRFRSVNSHRRKPNMKFAIAYVFACLAVVALAAPFEDPAQVQVVRQDADVGPEGYQFAVETSDGKSHQEQGTLKDAGGEEPSISVSGSYKFIADDGQTYEVTYVADENGFQPQGAHLPQV